jgi:hypothetical protein
MEWLMVMVNNKEEYLNDILIELPDCGEDFEIKLNDKSYILSPDEAKEFCMDYSRDTYSQDAVIGAKSEELFKDFIYKTGSIVTEI